MNAAPIRHFIVMSDTMSAEATKLLIEYFSSFGAGWAKYFTAGFLVATYDRNVNANDIATKLGQITPGVDCIALEVGSSKQWSFLVSDPELRTKLKTWLDSNW